jgi:hypothetical protein
VAGEKRFRLVAVLLVVMVAALVAGAVARPSPPTKKAGWADAANAVCARQNAAIRALPRETTQTIVYDFEAIAHLVRQANSQLDSIARPVGERATIESLLAASRSQLRLLSNEILPKLAHGLPATAAEIGKLNALSVVYNAKARLLGAKVCAENPVPQAPKPLPATSA